MLKRRMNFLAQMLGVRRTTVTGLARELLQTGVIRYTRGRIEIASNCGNLRASAFVCPVLCARSDKSASTKTAAK